MENLEETPEALFEKGKRFYLSTQGAQNDPGMALHYFGKAAGLGFSPAQRLLGICYLEGNIVPKDFTLARQWLLAASNQNDPQATYSLALIHAQGLGVEKNWLTAYNLLSRPGTSDLPESRELKRRLKTEITKLYPLLCSALLTFEQTLRSGLSHQQSRFIQPWLDNFNRDNDLAEFEAWLSLNLGQKNAEQTLEFLKQQLFIYYEQMKKCHPAKHS